MGQIEGQVQTRGFHARPVLTCVLFSANTQMNAKVPMHLLPVAMGRLRKSLCDDAGRNYHFSHFSPSPFSSSRPKNCSSVITEAVILWPVMPPGRIGLCDSL